MNFLIVFLTICIILFVISKFMSRGNVADQQWRTSNDYRKVFFRSNPGLFGFIWFCVGCKKPMFRNNIKHIVVDHVYPPSRRAGTRVIDGKTVRTRTRLSDLLNTRFNLTASCGPCNSAKSDKVGAITVKGYIHAFLGAMTAAIQALVVFIITMLLKLGYWIISSVLPAVWKIIWKTISSGPPLRRFLFVGAYAIVIIYLFSGG